MKVLKVIKNKLNKKTLIVVGLSTALIMGLCIVKRDTLKTMSIIGRFNAVARELSKDKYKNHEGNKLYAGGLIAGVSSYYDVYEVDKGIVKSYNEKEGLKAVLNGIKPIIEAPIITNSNEILSVLQMRGLSIKEKELSVPASTLNNMINGEGTLAVKLNVISNTINGIEDLKYVRIKGYNVDTLYLLGGDGGEYVYPMLSDDMTEKLKLDANGYYRVSELMEKLLLLEK